MDYVITKPPVGKEVVAIIHSRSVRFGTLGIVDPVNMGF